MRFFNNHICTSNDTTEVKVIKIDKKILTKEENKKIVAALKQHRTCTKKIETLRFLAKHLASGHKYVEFCLPYTLVYKQEPTSEFGSFPCSCNEVSYSNDSNFCNLVIAV